MALQHETLPVFGVQFHPEAALTDHGYQLLVNFLRLAGRPVSANVNALAAAENRRSAPPLYQAPTRPLTF